MRKTKIGVMDFHGSVDITDPCYDKDVWCRMNNVKISEGEYACYVWRHTDKGKYEDGTPYSYLLVGAIGISKSSFLDFIQVIILAHIIEITGKYRILRVTDKDIIFRLCKLHHTLRHTADYKILAVKLHCGIVQSRRQRCIGAEALFNLCYQILFGKRQHKFFHIHRIQRFHIDLSDGERELRSIDRNTQQTAHSDDVMFRSILAKVSASISANACASAL